MFITNTSKLLLDEPEIAKKVTDYNTCTFAFPGLTEKKSITFFLCPHGHTRNIPRDGREDYVAGCNL